MCFHFRPIGPRLFILAALLCALSALPAQEQEPAAGEEGAAGPRLFSLIPILETALGGELFWRPDWPLAFPPDGFSVTQEQAGSLLISLSDGVETYSFWREEDGRLREFPYFLDGSCLQVQVDYAPSGEIARISVYGAGETAEAWDFDFPSGAFSSGSSPPPVKAAGGVSAFFVFYQKTDRFLSETWYDEGGDLLAFFQAALMQNVTPRPGDSWRVSSIQSRTGDGPSTVEYYFDSDGNISEIRSPADSYSALYRDQRPVYWQRPDAGRFFLQWDGQGRQSLLLNLRPYPPEQAAELAPGELVECRYEYEYDPAGNWVSRQDIEIIGNLGVFVPQAGRTWTRRISIAEE